MDGGGLGRAGHRRLHAGDVGLPAGAGRRFPPVGPPRTPGRTGARHEPAATGIRYAYALLPIALFYHFAHNSMHFFVEGGALVPILSDPFG